MSKKIKIIITIIGALISAYLVLDLLVLNLPYPLNFRRFSSGNPLNRGVTAMLPVMIPLLIWWIPVARWKKQKDGWFKIFKIIGLGIIITTAILLLMLLLALLMKK